MRTRATTLLLGGALAAALAGAIGGAAPVAADDRVIVVEAGDTLGEIALRVGVPVERLAAINHLPDANRITVGQELRLKPAHTQETARRSRTHTLAYGETLSSIAVHYGTTVTALAAANGIADPSYVQAGAVLKIPGAAPVTTRHRVLPGETLWSIAQRYGTSIARLINLNRISNPGLIRAGTTLLVPSRSGAPTVSSDLHLDTLPASMAGAARRHAAVGRRIAAEASRQGVPVPLALALAWQESGWQAGLVSSAGALGPMQLLPATADWVGAALLHQAVNPRRTADNVRAGVALLGFYLDRYGDRRLALAAYYQGMTAVDRSGVYPVSRRYVDAIVALEPLFAR